MSSVFEDYGKEVEQRCLLSNLRTIMERMHLTAEQAMDALRVPVDDRDGIKREVATP